MNESITRENLKELLSNFIANNNLLNKDIAKAIGCSISSIERITNNRSYPSDEMIKQCGILFSIGYEGYKKLSKSDKEKISEGIGTVGGGVLGFGSITAVVSSLGYAGLSAAGITSGLAAAGGLVGGGMALGITAIAAIPVAAGTLSGGISASISGGNFWQGIRQGAITSGLNHIADHTLQKKKLPYTLIEDELYNHANIDVYTAKPPSISYDTADDLINKMPSLKSLKKQAKGYNLAGGRINSGKDPNGIQYGLTNHDNKTIYLYKETFTTWQKLALSIGHELMHAVHRTSGTWQSWYNTGGSSYAKNMTEYNAYNWEFIYTSQRGTFGSLEGLTKYGKLLGKTIPTPSSSHSNLFWH